MCIRDRLRDLDASGELNLKRRKEVSSFDAPPKSSIYQAIEVDEHGDLWCRQVGEDGLIGSKFIVAMSFGRDKGDSVGIGERFVGVSRKSKIDEKFEVKIIKKLGANISRLFGVLHLEPNQVGRIIPADRKNKHELMAVSYTHLDVYKRQHKTQPTFHRTATTLQRGDFGQKNGRIGYWTVSYTHLDVYKRQACKLAAHGA